MTKIDLSRGKGLLDLYTNGDTKVEVIVMRMIQEQKLTELNFLKDMGITGNLLYRLFDNCCYDNYINFYRTIHILMSGRYSKELILNNLNCQITLPFIASSLRLSDYNLDLHSDNLSEEYINKNVEIMLPIIEANIENTLAKIKK